MATVIMPPRPYSRSDNPQGKRFPEKHDGMGAIPHDAGVAFRVWAPNADSVAVIGGFDDWSEAGVAMAPEGGGTWYADLSQAKIGDEYRYLILNGDQRLSRIDPYAREVTNSIGNAVVQNPHFDWEGDDFKIANFNELVIYELHVGTFFRPDGETHNSPGEVGDFDDVAQKLRYLQRLGINAIQIMPAAEFAGDLSWGYNPAHIFAVESAYGGPAGLKRLVKEAHRHGIAVIMDVVYNHFGPSDLHLWQFDGWSENGKGGIYFYNDWRAATPWGETRPDYGRGEVRTFIRDNAMMWLEDYHVDGLRYDMTLFIRSVDGDEAHTLPDGWSLSQWVNRSVHEKFPAAITIAEDLRNNDWLTKPEAWGGAGFNSQWDANFVHPIREVVTAPRDSDRSMQAVKDALCHRYNLDAFGRVVYSESHDEVANGKQRVPSEIDPNDPTSYYAQKRSTLAAVMMFTAPGVPMLFQGQEFLRYGWFDDSCAIDWEQREELSGIVRLYQDLIRLRLNRDGHSRGLTGQRIEVSHLNDSDKVIAYRRWCEGDEASSVLVVANFSDRSWEQYRIGLSSTATLQPRFSSDARVYCEEFGDSPAGQLVPEEQSYDNRPYSVVVSLAPYSALIYS